MKILSAILLSALLLVVAAGNLKKAQTSAEVGKFNQDHLLSNDALFFYDASKEDESGVFNKVGNFISSIVGNDKKVSPTISLMSQISNETDTLAIDTSNPDFAQVVAQFEATATPWVVVFNEGSAIIKEIPNENTLKKIQAFKRISKVDQPNTDKPATVTPVVVQPQVNNTKPIAV